MIVVATDYSGSKGFSRGTSTIAAPTDATFSVMLLVIGGFRSSHDTSVTLDLVDVTSLSSELSILADTLRISLVNA